MKDLKNCMALLLVCLIAFESPNAHGVVEQHSNKHISISFQDVPVREVLQLMAEYNDFDIVVSDSVSGNITLRIEELPWQSALNIILHIKGLGQYRKGRVILVAPQDELDKRQQQELQLVQLAESLIPLDSKVFEIHYANASDLAGMFNGEKSSGLLSERESISVDERTNSLLVRATPTRIKVIRKLIESLDVPVRQVQIETRLVSIKRGNLDELGVRWGLSGNGSDGAFSGSVEGNRGLMGEGDGSLNLDSLLNVNLGSSNVSSSSIAFTLGKLSGVLLDLELSALQAESKAEIISSPRLVTANKKPAYIEQGTEIPYLEAASSGAASVSFKKAALSLKVTPQITPDNKLVLDLSVTQDKPGETVRTGLGEAVAIDTQRIGTQVLVDNGETLVLGGIIQHDARSRIDKVPVLGDLPGIGNLFQRRYEKQIKSELLIFVTPKVITD